MTFLDIGILDIIDIVLVAFLLYQVYMLIKGTAAIKIFSGIAAMYLVWLIVKALNMQLLSTILGQIMGVGVIALLIVFQQEVRNFFLLISNKYLSNIDFSFKNVFSSFIKKEPEVKVWSIVKACVTFSKNHIGALITITKESELQPYIETGIKLNADTSVQLLESIFFHNNPLHDGSVIISKDKIKAAKCILPVSENKELPSEFGLRHRSAHGLAEQTDSVVIVVSEETGFISLFKSGTFKFNIKTTELRKELENEFLTEKKNED